MGRRPVPPPPDQIPDVGPARPVRPHTGVARPQEPASVPYIEDIRSRFPRPVSDSDVENSRVRSPIPGGATPHPEARLPEALIRTASNESPRTQSQMRADARAALDPPRGVMQKAAGNAYPEPDMTIVVTNATRVPSAGTAGPGVFTVPASEARRLIGLRLAVPARTADG